jgi:predicted Rdx family selenoprotein
VAAALAHAVGVRAELIDGDNGIFDVAVDGEVVYSRHKTGEFPTDFEIVALVRGRMGMPAV